MFRTSINWKSRNLLSFSWLDRNPKPLLFSSSKANFKPILSEKNFYTIPTDIKPLVSDSKSASALSQWQQAALDKLHKEQMECNDTPLTLLWSVNGVKLYIKNESLQPTGTHKHRLARSLIAYAIKKGVNQGTTLVEASSGSTARSEAYFAKLLNLDYVAVVPRGTPQEKIDAIMALGGKVLLCEPGQDKIEAQKLAQKPGWHFLDQFKNAADATNYKENNIAEELYKQHLVCEGRVPNYIVCGAGTGGTSATLGRYSQYYNLSSEIIVVDPQNSAYFEAYKTKKRSITTGKCSRIGGIGRPRVEPSFLMNAIDDMIQVPDAASIGAIHFLKNTLGISAGGSAGTNLYGSMQLMKKMIAQGQKGSIVTFLFDKGELYQHTYFDQEWLKKEELNIQPYMKEITDFYATSLESKKSVEPHQPIFRCSP